MEKLTKWARITWWLLLVGFFAYLLSQRYDSIISGASTPMDVVVFLILVAFLAIPLFQEVNILGVGFKKEINELRNELKNQIISLKSEIQSTVNVYPPYTPMLPESELQKLKKTIDEIYETVKDRAKMPRIRVPEEIEIPDNAQFLFSVRYEIENELKRIWRVLDLDVGPRTTMPGLLRVLAEISLITGDVYLSIREVYAICSAAIHGEDVSETKVNFVRDVAPELIAYLKTIGEKVH